MKKLLALGLMMSLSSVASARDIVGQCKVSGNSSTPTINLVRLDPSKTYGVILKSQVGPFLVQVRSGFSQDPNQYGKMKNDMLKLVVTERNNSADYPISALSLSQGEVSVTSLVVNGYSLLCRVGLR